jgi:hypothetical protein
MEKTISKAQEKRNEQENALRVLREALKPGDTVSTILRHVSRSGMMRSISLIVARDGEPWDISYFAARVLDDRIDERRGGIRTGGCGMDMGFHLVYSLSRRLFPEGFVCPGEEKGRRCPSNDHFNDHSTGMERKNYAGKIHKGDGGYALTHRWL